MTDMKGCFDMKLVSRTTDIVIRTGLVIGALVMVAHLIVEYIKGR